MSYLLNASKAQGGDTWVAEELRAVNNIGIPFGIYREAMLDFSLEGEARTSAAILAALSQAAIWGAENSAEVLANCAAIQSSEVAADE